MNLVRFPLSFWKRIQNQRVNFESVLQLRLRSARGKDEFNAVIQLKGYELRAELNYQRQGHDLESTSSEGQSPHFFRCMAAKVPSTRHFWRHIDRNGISKTTTGNRFPVTILRNLARNINAPGSGIGHKCSWQGDCNLIIGFANAGWEVGQFP